MKSIKIAFIIGILLSNPVFAEAPEPIEKPIDFSKENIINLVNYYADKYKVSREIAHYVASNESHYDNFAVGDLDIIHTPTGKPVFARGVFQITRAYHPEISDKQAFDPEFNIEWAIKTIAKGKKTCMREFSTCRAYYNNVKL